MFSCVWFTTYYVLLCMVLLSNVRWVKWIGDDAGIGSNCESLKKEKEKSGRHLLLSLFDKARTLPWFGEVNGKDLAILVQGGQASNGRRAAEGVVQRIRV
ncbi:hypothetical protein PVK06_001234 [Gossypium arboreum]|uniref:Uncharacterized protein n=1 Tax=Gossypium arboreum TaxID=29729 RepID=A0ABR0R0J5_GOSAR|nr:hypothetical protein PVK06_001234 [Gossypium arboreum]